MSVRLPFHGAKVLKIILGFLMVKQITIDSLPSVGMTLLFVTPKST